MIPNLHSSLVLGRLTGATLYAATADATITITATAAAAAAAGYCPWRLLEIGSHVMGVLCRACSVNSVGSLKERDNFKEES